MGAGEDIMRRLAAQDTELAALRKDVTRLLAHLGADRATSNGVSAAGTVATLMQIQGEYGDFEIGKMPKNWTGANFEGYLTSECAPDFLDFYADFLDWKAANPRKGKEQYAKYDALNGQRCRRWAIEIREGRHKPQRREAVPTPPPPGDYEWTSGGAPSNDGLGPPPGDFDLPPPPDDDCPF